MAPESIKRCDYSEKSEVYSLAKGCYEILCHGVYPHTGYSDLDVASVIRQVGCVYKLYKNLQIHFDVTNGCHDS